MTSLCSRISFTVGTALLLTSAAMAQTTTGNSAAAASNGTQSTASVTGPSGTVKSSSSRGRLSAADRKFVIKAAQGGFGEVSLGKVAQTHAADSGVKQFGQQMVTDHSQANRKLAQIATEEHVTTPKGPGPEEKATLAKLSRLHGASFDRAYVNDMVKDHKKDIADFQKEAKNGKDPAVKSFAVQTLPTLKMHLHMVQSLKVSKRSGMNQEKDSGNASAGNASAGNASGSKM